MQTNLSMEMTPGHVGSQSATEGDDGPSESSEQFKLIRITVALLVPRKNKSGKDKKPDVI
jgi:hypothetical protein